MKTLKRILLCVAVTVIFMAQFCHADPLDTWTSRNSGTSQQLSSIACGNGRFVAIKGDIFTGFSILYSQDGTNWVQGQNGQPLAQVRNVAFGNNLFVEVGVSKLSGSGVAITSNGTNWSVPSSVPGSTLGPFLEGVTYGNGLFVAVGISGTLLTSADGTNWIQRTSGTTDTLQRVAYGNGIYVAVGWMYGTVLTSKDAINWTSQAGISAGMVDLTFGNGHFVAVGDYGAIKTSPDGTNWTSIYAPVGYLYGISYGGGAFVAVADSGNILFSLDRTMWTQRYSGSSNALECVCYGHNFFVVAGANGTLLESQPLGAASPLVQTLMAGSITTDSAQINGIINPDGLNTTAQFQYGTTSSYGGTTAGGNFGTTLQSIGYVVNGLAPDTTYHYRIVASNSGGTSYGLDSYFTTVAIYPPSINTQSYNETAQTGDTAAFTVWAFGSSPMNYQWQFNGQNLPNATNATLILNSVTAANSGGYSVVVSNPYGFVTSATATLAVLTDGANGNKPVPITATPGWSKSSTAKNLVFITHGWQPVEANPLGPPAQPWMAAMTNTIAQQLGGNSTWQFETYDWTWAAWTLEPQQALSQAEYIGTQLGKAIAGMGYQQVHLIAHSAGSGMIQAIADQLQAAPNPPLIQLTFLDPYIGIFHQEQNNYGKNADWSDCYFVEDGSGGFTGSYLNHAFNVDVSWVDPAHTTAPYIGPGGGEVALSSHGYPIDFYLGSITGGNSSCSSAYGFPLSQEMEGVFWFNNQANDPVGSGPLLPCSPPDAVKNPNPGIASLESGIAGIPFDISSAAYALSNLGSSLVGNAGFVLNSIWSSLPLVKSGGVQPMGGPVPLGGSSTNSPAWLAVGVTVTNAVNFVQFDAGFTDTNVAQGLLTVYWNTNQVGMVDERVAPTNLQTYRFTLPGTVSSGIYTLSFRLDSFANSSTVAVTNVATGFVGVTQPITLNISLTHGSPMLQLTGPAGYIYLVQTSTNLVEWTPTALLANTNGTVSFVDLSVTNSSQQFYRAVMFSSIAAAPLLQAQVSGNNFILSWPASASGYVLETTTNLTATNSWVAVTNTPALLNQQSVVTNQISGAARFYRLRK